MFYRESPPPRKKNKDVAAADGGNRSVHKNTSIDDSEDSLALKLFKPPTVGILFFVCISITHALPPSCQDPELREYMRKMLVDVDMETVTMGQMADRVSLQFKRFDLNRTRVKHLLKQVVP